MNTTRVVSFITLVSVSVLAVVVASKWPEVLSKNQTKANDVEASKFISLPAASPARLQIAKLAIDVPFGDEVGVLPSGEMALPNQSTEVSLYTHAHTPGEIGPAIVVGNSVTETGPGVFSALHTLDTGDMISVTRDDGVEALFVVTDLKRNVSEHFPVADVYGEVPHAGIRLLTCTAADSNACRHDVAVIGELIATSTAAN